MQGNSVILDFCVNQSSSCKVLTFYEQTGAYSATNTGGFGSPNESTTNAVAAILTVTPPTSAVGTQFNLFTNSPAYPQTNDTVGFGMKSQDLGMTADIAFPDGIYTFVYTVTTSAAVYVQTKTIFLSCNAACCVNKQIAEVAADTCDCEDDEDFQDALKVYVLYQALCYAATCGNVNRFSDLLNAINSYCNITSCNSCN